MKEVMQGEMSEHDENRIVGIFTVLGSPMPDLGCKFSKPPHQSRATVHILLQRALQVHTKEEVVRFNSTGIVRRNDRFGLCEYLIKSLREQPVDLGQVTGVLVNGPFRRGRPSLQQAEWNFADQRHHDVRSSLERINDGYSGFHNAFGPSSENRSVRLLHRWSRR